MPGQSVPITNCWRRKKITLIGLSATACTQHRLWIGKILPTNIITEPIRIRTIRTQTKNKPYIVVPYVKGLSESCRNICRKHGTEMSFKGANTIREFLVHLNDKDNILKKSGVIYRYECGRVDCEDKYIGGSDRTFAERFREHMKSPSPIHDHFNTTGHEVSLDNFSIVGREDQSITRTIREAMLIKVDNPSLNRNIGKYQLPHIWDEVLVKSPELELK